ncbi:MAG: hypothetical protein A2900_05595 [Candidatus Chisholmbacteria bacterium RIFCSPLOWO2_01_FULL_50_28]|uniref:Peptidase M16 n=1 Tax=Candidatus Chisholmbacteria bacterium RIFCSPHIGHO2_01_FULL_52_32 TaxID=1797591 RepID=A0A1G1VRT4_9BACT|nr:MAG: hypothetical protein A2786_01150 [Candidatus Chisholmbacteria bacterium RIFCSPHIGHO2_01_FULL_52_32]OGY20516.1 MAG: hypothetical protein A2900_05595 [Candidatus Chisholmbacteria bacterium RIFCSPLOWO2_01_FULL_50_28]
MDERYRKFIFPSGLTLLTVPMPGVESVTILVMVRTGSRDEPSELSGISHFLEHMVFKGTAKYPSALALTSAIDSVGGEFNAFTSKEFTGFYVKVASAHLDKGIDVLSQMLTAPKLLASDIEREKGVVVEEINLYEDLPTHKVSDVFDRLMYGANGLGRETAGSKETVKSLSREDLLRYLRGRYTATRTVVGVVGGVGGIDGEKEMRRIRESVGRAFAPLGKDRISRWGSPVELPRRSSVALHPKKTNQAHFILGVPAFRRGHRDRFALAVLATILGGNMSSRLFSEVREKRGLAYYVKSDVDIFFDTGSISVHTGVEVGKIDEAIRVTLLQLRLAANGSRGQGISATEVVAAKDYLKGQFILDLEDSHEVADHFVRRYLLEQRILTPGEFLAMIDRVRPTDVVRVAKTLFNGDGLRLAVVGPYSEKDRQRWERMIQLKVKS